MVLSPINCCVRIRPLLALMIFGDWRLSFFTSQFQEILGTPGPGSDPIFAPSVAELCGSVGAARAESQVLGCSVAGQRDRWNTFAQ